MLHAKTCVVDEEVGLVGTANLDNRSLRLNFEAAAVLYGPRPTAALAGVFERDLAGAREKRGREADAPFVSRLGASAAGLLGAAADAASRPPISGRGTFRRSEMCPGC